MMSSLRQVTWHRLILAGCFTALSYLALTGFDFLGVLYAGARVAYWRVALASFVSLSIGHTVGLAPLSSGAIRYRFYSQWGLRAAEIVMVIGISAMTVTLGETTIVAGALLGRSGDAARILHLPQAAVLWAGGGCAAALAAYFTNAVVQPRGVRMFGRTIKAPKWRVALGQILIGTANYVLVAAALQQSLGPAAVDYPTTATAYILANLAALLSHVPGGLGVTEAAIVTLLPKDNVIGGLIAFRVVYFFVPLAIGTLLFGVAEVVRYIKRGRAVRRGSAICVRNAAE